MNDRAGAENGFEADEDARRYARRFSDVDGNLRHKVLSMHTTIDGLVIPENESAFLQRVEDTGKTRNLVQVYVDAIGHCNFTPAQWASTLEAMDFWLESCDKPDSRFFQGPGFDDSFVPGPWRQPTP